MNFEKSLVNVKAFLPDDEEIVKIIEICDLQPTEESWMHWVDHAGNSLHIRKDKTIFVSKSAKKTEHIVKDIHFKAPIDVISKNSKWALICFAESCSPKVRAFFRAEGYPNMCFIWFLGKDDKLRLCILMKNEWIENQPPLITSATTLRTIVKNLEVEKYKIINFADLKEPYTSFTIKAWATKWPPATNLILDMMLTYQPIALRLSQDCNLVRETKE